MMKNSLLVLFGLFIWLSLPMHSFATIAFDATASSTKAMGGANGNLQISNLGGAGANMFAVGCASYYNNNGGTDSIDSATYGGVAMTAFGASVTNGPSVSRAFYLINPPTGTQTYQINYTNNVNDPILGSISTYTGVDQATGFRNYNTKTGSTNNPNVTITSAIGDVVYDCANAGVGSGGASIVIGGSGTKRAAQSAAANGDRVVGGAGEWVGAASVATTWTLSAIMTWSDLGWSMIPAATTTILKPKWIFGAGQWILGAGKWIFN